MTKAELISETAKNSGHSHAECRMVIEVFLKLIPVMATTEKIIELRNFGTFIVKWRKPRPARNPRTGEVIKLLRRKVLLLKFPSDFLGEKNERI
jgi:DNA-binding protein HU-beta/integration host factor subunit beta